jgi:hypothetical protein
MTQYNDISPAIPIPADAQELLEILEILDCPDREQTAARLRRLGWPSCEIKMWLGT